MGNKIEQELLKEIKGIKYPFILKDLEKNNINIKRSQLDNLIEKGHLNKRSIGRMTVYWNKESPPSQVDRKSYFETEIARLELNVKELTEQLMEEKKKNQQLKRIDAMDDPWKEVAMEMAHVLSEIRQVPLKEVLTYFNAPIDDDF